MIFRSMTALCLLATQVQAEVPNVITDIAPVHSLAARVMQGVGEPSMVMPQGASPHHHSLRPSEARALSGSDLVIWIGEDLSPWLKGAIENLAPNARSLELLHLEGTHVLNFREEAVFGDHDEHDEHHDDHDDHDDHGEDKHDDHGEEDHKDEHDDHGQVKHGHDEHHDDEKEAHADEHGDEHKDEHHDDHAEGHVDEHGHAHAHDGHDPHAWLDPENAVFWLNAIATTLSEIDPANADVYAMNAKVGATEIEAAAEKIEAELVPVKDASFLVFHDAYQYFETAFGLNVTGALSVSDATPPSAARLAELREEIKEHGISCVFAEPQFNPNLVTAIAPEGTNTGILDPLGTNVPAGPNFYAAFLRSLADSATGCLK